MNNINIIGKGGEAWTAALAEAEAADGWLYDAPPNWLSNEIIQQTKAGGGVSLTTAEAAAAEAAAAAAAATTTAATAAAAAQAVLTAQAEATAAAATATAAATAKTTAENVATTAASTKESAQSTRNQRFTANNTANTDYNNAVLAYNAALAALQDAIDSGASQSDRDALHATKEQINAEKSYYNGIKNTANTNFTAAETALTNAENALTNAQTALTNAENALSTANSTNNTKANALASAIQTKTMADDEASAAAKAAALTAEAAKITASIAIVTNSPIYNKFISGYIRGESGFALQNSTSITFSTGSTTAYFDVQLTNVYQKLEFEIVLENELTISNFIFGNEYEKDGLVIYTTKTDNIIRAIVTPYEYKGVIEFIFAELTIAIKNEIVQTPEEITAQNVTKSVFELVESGLTLCQIEVLKKERLNEILNNIENLRNYSRTSGVSTTYNNNGNLNQAGATYTENFPSAKFAKNVSMNTLLLNKKNYMFSNSLNKNVISGAVGFNSLNNYHNDTPFIAGSSSGLTKVQQYANTARGRSPSGGVGRRYGVQFFNGRTLVSIPNIYNQTNQTNEANQTINLCALGN
jgi:hypothetical protein